MTNCDAVRELLAESGSEASKVPADVQTHLDGCASCARLRETLRAIESDLKALPPQDMPAALAGDILRAVRAEDRDASSSRQFQDQRPLLLRALESLGLAADRTFRLAWRQIWAVAGTAAVVMLVIGAGLFSSAPRYTAEALLEIQPSQAENDASETLQSASRSEAATIETEIGIIRSREIARRVVADLNLFDDPEFNPHRSETGDASRPEDSDKALVTVVDAFLDRLTVRQRGQSRLVAIQVESEAPEKAIVLANAVADSYIAAQLEAKFESTRRATEWLAGKAEELRLDIAATERTIEDHRVRTEVLSASGASLDAEQVSALRTQFVLEQSRLAEARARLKQAENLLDAPTGMETTTETLNSVLLLDLRRQEAELQHSLAETSEIYGERHPALVGARGELADLQSKIKSEVDKIVQGLRNEVSVAEARSSSLARALDVSKRELARSSELDTELRALERDAEASRRLLEALLERIEETATEDAFGQADAIIVSPAVLAERPSLPNAATGLALAFAGALGLGLLVAFAIERRKAGRRNRIRSTRLGALLIPLVVGLGSVISAQYALAPAARADPSHRPHKTEVPASPDSIGFPRSGDIRSFDRLPSLPPTLAKGEQDYIRHLENTYGDVDAAMRTIGCKGQAPGQFNAVYRTGDILRDAWCSGGRFGRLVPLSEDLGK